MTDRPNVDHVPIPKELELSKAPLISTKDVNTCPVCASGNFSPYAYGYDYEIQTCRNEWRFVECSCCQHVWLNPRPAIAELPVIYPPTYYAYDYEQNINPIAVWGKGVLDRLKFRGILKYLDTAPKSYCDVGCGSGRFLRLMHTKGVVKIRNYGLELEERSVEQLKKDGYQVFVERIEDCTRIPDGSLDLITMFHVIEHVDDPGKVIQKLARLLSDNGVIALETPNIDSLDARRFKTTYWGGYHIPRHWNLFKLETMQRLLSDHGLELVATKYQTGHSFWMYSNHHSIRYGEGNVEKGMRFDPFKGSLVRLIAFTFSDIIRAMFGAKTSAILLIARKRKH
jgi:2-polyprenyl-3-methyl-5-hydroxy-6-metoxy-1,4-benzoquinol methylase